MSKIERRINLVDEEPVYLRPYPLPYALRQELKDEIREMLDMGVIRKSSSTYALPVVIVKKKDGSNRICVNYRKLNKVTIADPEPMKTSEDLFQQLGKSKFFSKIDLSKGYWQIPIAEEDVFKTAFVTSNDDNLDKIARAKRPVTKKEVRSFCGLLGYYRDYIPSFAIIAAPLTDLAKKGQPNFVEWDEAQEKAFNTLREVLLKRRILRLPDYSIDFTLRADASNSGIGAVLMQEHKGKLHPVAYASKNCCYSNLASLVCCLRSY